MDIKNIEDDFGIEEQAQSQLKGKAPKIDDAYQFEMEEVEGD